MNSSGTNKQVLLITSTNLACNPRCLKELELLYKVNMDVTVVAFELHNWTTEQEKLLVAFFPKVKFNYIDASKRRLLPWLKATLAERLAGLLLRLNCSDTYLNAMAFSKRSWLLQEWTKQATVKPDLIIAHNPAAFYSAYWLAKKHQIPFALDVEDYHPGEGTDQLRKAAVGLLMKRLMPLTSYNSFASPLIKDFCFKLAGNKLVNKNITVNNTFPSGEFVLPETNGPLSEKLQLVWFSQFIDYGRGLEKILPVLDKVKGLVQLTLIGNIRRNFLENELQKRSFVKVTGPLSQKKLNAALASFDVGLAIEDVKEDTNRDICLTNKIWAYFQAGLYIFASATSAQQKFLAEHPDHGICTALHTDTLETTIQGLIKDKLMIRSIKMNRFTAAKAYSWEHESKALSKIWKGVLA